MQQQPSGSSKRKTPTNPTTVFKPSLEKPDSPENTKWTPFPTDEFLTEKIALEKWFDSDDSGPTIASYQPPTSTLLPDSSSSNGQPHNPTGFDDDFSDFVSAPTSAFATTDTTSESLADEAISETEDDQYPNDPEDDLFGDDFFPTDQEILMTSHRIFDPHLPSQRANSSRSALADGQDGDNSSGDVYFDLSGIMGALQGLKEEISGIEDEDTKRRMAARVAMGLLYGLEGRSSER